jgi:hypothetical protein
MHDTEKPEPRRNGRKGIAPEEQALDSLEAITQSVVEAHGELHRAVSKVRRAEAALARWVTDAEKVLGHHGGDSEASGVSLIGSPDRSEGSSLIPVGVER